MKFRGLYLTEEGKPKFNQPVPLVLVPLITDWTCCQLLELLGKGVNVGDRVIYVLNVFGYDGTSKPKSVRPSLYARLFEEIPDNVSDGQEFELLPPHHFVWSEHLILGFTEMIDLTWNREDAHNAGAELIWDIDTTRIRDYLEKCPDFEKLLDQAAIRQDKTRLRYEDICKRRQALIDSGNPN